MPPTYPDRFGTDDRSAATLAVVLHQGDDYAGVVRFLSLHAQADGTFLKVPTDISNVVFDSEIHDGTGDMVAEFQILDHDDMGVLSFLLPGADTRNLPVGSYRYWIQGNNFDTGYSTEKLQGTIEVRPK